MSVNQPGKLQLKSLWSKDWNASWSGKDDSRFDKAKDNSKGQGILAVTSGEG